MAAKDRHIIHATPENRGRHTSYSGLNAFEEPVELQDSLLAAVIRKRWWLLCICGILSGVVAYMWATQFGQITAVSQGSLLYSGLPTPPGPRVYEPPKLMTYSELLLSISTMHKLCAKHGLGMPPAGLREFYRCKVNRDSNIMSVQLTWADAEDGIQMVNDAMELLIDEAAARRQELLRKHIKHVEVALLETKSEVADMTERLQRMRKRRDERFASGGLAEDRYSSALDRITNSQSAIDLTTSKKLALEQQLVQVRKSVTHYDQLLRKRLPDLRIDTIEELSKPHRHGTEKWKEFVGLRRELTAYAESAPPELSYEDWKIGLEEIGDDLLPALESTLTRDLQNWEQRLEKTQAKHSDLTLQLIPVNNQLELLQRRLDEYEKNAERLAEDVTGMSIDEISEYEKKVDETELRRTSVQHQLDNMRQLEQCKTREFSISAPATLESTKTTSNKKKLFVLAFLISGMVLVAPVFLAEWLLLRETPVRRVASRFGLPVIADRLLGDYSPTNRRQHIDWRDNEALRMLTLRIQQCSHSGASVVVFSAMRSSTEILPLIVAVAECLAEREERVLLIDAIDPSTVPISLANSQFKLLPLGRQSSERNDLAESKPSPGLAEYFARECEDAMDLIQPTACPGVDWIASGNNRFPSEALASSSVTKLLEHCRKTYTMLLVAGPPVASQADLQMLAARADGIVLATDKRGATDPSCHAALQDLIELGAPIVGIVG